MLTLNDGRAELWQWDTGRTLEVDADCSQVHFSNKVFGRSIDVDVVVGKAIIPDVLLQTDKDLTVWAFVGTAENGYTKISKTFKVNRRNKPADYVFTPVEQTTIAEIAAIAQSVRDDADNGLFDGAQGPAGHIGPVGPQGEQGLRGEKGEKGEKGDIGPQGPQGEQGPQGIPGTQGPQGIPGTDGRDGVDGKDGAPGADGHTPEYGVDYGTPEQISGIAQQAAEILNPELNQINKDIAAVSAVCGTLENTEGGTVIQLTDCAERSLKGLRIFGRTVQDGTPTPEAPAELVSVGDGGSVSVTVYGKNLFADGKVYLGGLDSSYGQISIGSPVESPVHRKGWAGVGIRVAVRPNNTYTVSSDITPCKYFTVTFYKEFDSVGSKENAISFKEFRNGNNATFTTPENCHCVVITAVSNVESEYTWSWWQLENGSVATAYEPYKGKTLTIPTPNGLPGIPVTSGGNYTDANGQQWICDEVDFARGVRIVRFKHKRVSPNLNWQYSSATNRFYVPDNDYKLGDFNVKIPNVICTHFKTGKGADDKIISYINDSIHGYAFRYSALNGDVSAWKNFLTNNEVYIIGELDRAIEIPLTTDEISAYSALHTYKPNTTIYNDADAQMDVGYQADTKLYIDKQFAELRNAIVSLGGNV